jgi:hypothetical protein
VWSTGARRRVFKSLTGDQLMSALSRTGDQLCRWAAIASASFGVRPATLDVSVRITNAVSSATLVSVVDDAGRFHLLDRRT